MNAIAAAARRHHPTTTFSLPGIHTDFGTCPLATVHLVLGRVAGREPFGEPAPLPAVSISPEDEDIPF
jgi:hypothetical protein